MKLRFVSLAASLLVLFGLLGPFTAPAAWADASVAVTAPWNVALHATATASGQCNAGEAAGAAVDGRTDTKWCDNSGAKDKWLQLDLGQAYNINSWTVKNAAINESSNRPFWNTKDFRLQKSADGMTWEDVDVVTNNAQTIVERYVPTFSARHIRLWIDKGSYDNHTVRLYEFELYGVEADQLPAYPAINLAPVEYVDPFINTLGDNGQTNPGPKTPFGLVSLGPDSEGGAFSGYYYENPYLKGFSHLRFSGVGCSGAGGNILLMPQTGSFTNKSGEYRQKYDKSSEQASPGYYAVRLDSGIGVELTASDNVGFHRYTFPNVGTGSVLVDLSNAYAGMVNANLQVENGNEISGMVQAKNVCGHGYYTMYYSIQFDHPFESYTTWQDDATGTEATRTGTKIGVWANFSTASDRVIQAKVGLSPISVEQAKYEREHDVPDWNFDAQHAKTRSEWSDLLSKVEIKDADEENKRVFYTQLYHAFLHPNNVTSSVGTFKAGRDEQTVRHTSEIGDDFEYYNGWTTWDDFRKYALFSVLVPKQYENMVKSLVDLYRTRGSYTQWGEGYWPSPTVRNEFNGAVVLDAYAKGFHDFDVYAALQGMAVDADHFSISDSEISGKLEQAKSGYFPMKLAEMIGDKQTYDKYKPVALSYKQLWNPEQVDENGDKYGFFTPNAATVDKSDVTKVDKYAYQGNLWTYRYSATQDMKGLAELMGGNRQAAEQLIDMFQRDEYLGVNEAQLDAPYLFNYLGFPYLTQHYARKFTTEVVTQKYHNHGPYAHPIQSRIYRADPEGYLPSMDDDAGAMSSWFVYSAMGLFPGNPGDANFLIGSPIFSELKLRLDGGKSFTIKANQVSAANRFIQSAKLNGDNFDQAWIAYDDIMAGGTLEFEMGPVPNARWGAAASVRPTMADYDRAIVGTIVRDTLIPEQSDWKYHDEGRDPGAGWTEPDYDDGAWKVGQAMLGYGKAGSVNTVISYGPNGSDKYPTAYFRKEFEMPAVSGMIGLEAGLIRDDGAIVYLNGHEVIRTNMPPGAAGYGTYANGTVGDERNWERYMIDPAYLVEGTNVLTAEVHQVNATSSDLAFDFSLRAIRKLESNEAYRLDTDVVRQGNMSVRVKGTLQGEYDGQAVAVFQLMDGSEKAWVSSAVPVGPSDFDLSQQFNVQADKYQMNLYLVDRFNGNIYDSQWLAEPVVSQPEAKPGNSGAYPDSEYEEPLPLPQDDVDPEEPEPGDGLAFEFESRNDWSPGVHPINNGPLKTEANNGGTVVANTFDGAWLAYYDVDFGETGVNRISVEYDAPATKTPADARLEIRLDSPDGPLAGKVALAQTGSGWGTYAAVLADLDDTVTGKHDVYIIMRGSTDGGHPYIGNMDRFAFSYVPIRSDFGKLELETFDDWSTALNPSNSSPMKKENGNSGLQVANTFDGAWLAYKRMDFGEQGVNRISVHYAGNSNNTAADSAIEVRLGGTTGTLAGKVAIPPTGPNWSQYQTVTGTVYGTITGVQDVYFVLTGTTDGTYKYIGNVDYATFWFEETEPETPDEGLVVEFEDRSEWNPDNNAFNGKPLKTEANNGGTVVANTFDGAWLKFQNVDFGGLGANEVEVVYDAPSTKTPNDIIAEIRLGSVGGMPVGTVALPNTGSGWGTYATAKAELATTIRGVQDLYVVMRGSSTASLPYVGNLDRLKFGYEPVRDDYAKLELETFDDWSTTPNPANGNPLKKENGKSGQQVANTFDGAWLAYKRMDFGVQGVNELSVYYASNSGNCAADSMIEVRLGSMTGELAGTIAIPPTGANWNNYQSVSGSLLRTIAGIQDVYLVLTGTTDATYKYVGNIDYAGFSLTP